MRKIYSSILSLVIVASFVGCSEDDVVAALAAPVSITTVESAENSIDSIASLSSTSSMISSPMTQSISLVQSMSASLSPSLSASLASQTTQCDTGSYTINYASVTSFSIDYDNCVHGTFTFDGSITASGTTFTTNDYTYTDSSTGTIFNMNLVTTVNADFTEQTMSGTVSYTIPNDSGSFVFTNFRSATSNGKLNISGTVSIVSNMYPCTDGSFTIATPIDLTPNVLVPGFSAGTMTVNGVTFVFNADGTAVVTFADGSSSTINQNQPQVCSI